MIDFMIRTRAKSQAEHQWDGEHLDDHYREPDRPWPLLLYDEVEGGESKRSDDRREADGRCQHALKLALPAVVNEARSEGLQGWSSDACQDKDRHDRKDNPPLLREGHDDQRRTGSGDASQNGASLAEQFDGWPGQNGLCERLADTKGAERHTNPETVPLERITAPQGPAGAVRFASSTQEKEHEDDRPQVLHRKDPAKRAQRVECGKIDLLAAFRA